MDYEKLTFDDFISKSAGQLRAKIMRVVPWTSNNKVDAYAICLSNEKLSFTIFNHWAVEGDYDPVNQTETQEDMFETVFLVGGKQTYDKIEPNSVFQFSAKWPGGAIQFGPVKATELSKGGRPEFVRIEQARVHRMHHSHEMFEYLIEMFFVTAAEKWQFSSIPDHPIFFKFEKLASE
ncbi:MAG TPA: hypothetical protein VFI23_10265 [Rhizomicrobium sp.]|nr:hypothetical protein [Rhizomicrobium sp.]